MKVNELQGTLEAYEERLNERSACAEKKVALALKAQTRNEGYQNKRGKGNEA